MRRFFLTCVVVGDVGHSGGGGEDDVDCDMAAAGSMAGMSGGSGAFEETRKTRRRDGRWAVLLRRVGYVRDSMCESE